MEVAEIKAQIQSHQLQPFYIFTGPEWRVQRMYIDKIASVSGRELRYVDSVADVYKSLTNRSFVQKQYTYVVRDDTDLMNDEKLQKRLNEILNKNTLILILTTLDKRVKFYKAYKDTICEFEPLKPQILRKYIQKEIPLSDKNADKLAEVCENDYGRCLLEIDKILSLEASDLEGCYYDANEAFSELLERGAIYQPPKDAIFDFVDAVLDHKVNLSYELYNHCLGVGEAVMVMLTVLYNNAKAVLQVQSCKGADVSKSTGLTGWQVMNAKKHFAVYSNHELIRLMRLIQKCQSEIVSGLLDEEYAIEYILTDTFGGVG